MGVCIFRIFLASIVAFLCFIGLVCSAIAQYDEPPALVATTIFADSHVVSQSVLAMVTSTHQAASVSEFESTSADDIIDDSSTISDPVKRTATEQLHDYLVSLGDEAKTLAGFEDCVCGVNFNGEYYDVYYSLPAMILQLMRDSDMGKFDALEFIQYNTVRSLDYEKGPIIIDAAFSPTISQKSPPRNLARTMRILTEQVMSLKEAAEAIEKITSKKPDKSTLYRWCTKGLKGRFLEHERVGGNIITSKEALERFIERTN